MEDIYRQLQKHFDRAPVGYPPTKSGVELKLLKDLFTEEEARIALNLSIIPETANKIYSRFKKSDLSASKIEDHLDKMAEKGTIMSSIKSKKNPVKVYSRLPLAFGMFEFQVNRIDKETARDYPK